MRTHLSLALGALLAATAALPSAAMEKKADEEVSSIVRVTGRVIGFMETKGIIMQLDDGRIVSYTLLPTATFPVDLVTGSRVTLGLRHISVTNPQVVDMMLETRPGLVVDPSQSRMVTAEPRPARPKLTAGESKLTGFADEAIPGKVIVFQTIQGKRMELMFPSRTVSTEELAAGARVSATVEELRAEQQGNALAPASGRQKSVLAAAKRPTAVGAGVRGLGR